MTEPRGLLRARAVMDRLRSPGGCPWDAEQTHASLAKYLVEETYELIDAIESGERADLREELGDVLLQVLFHARIAEDDPVPFDIDDVADDLADKLVRRHPNVFADVEVNTAAEVDTNWEAIKAAEKQRSGPYDGLARSQPALALATGALRRAERAGADLRLTGDGPQAQIAGELLEIVRKARYLGVDPELALRSAVIGVIEPA